MLLLFVHPFELVLHVPKFFPECYACLYDLVQLKLSANDQIGDIRHVLS